MLNKFIRNRGFLINNTRKCFPNKKKTNIKLTTKQKFYFSFVKTFTGCELHIFFINILTQNTINSHIGNSKIGAY